MENMDSSKDYSFKSATFDGFKEEDQEMKKSPETIDMFESIKSDNAFEEEEYRKETRKRLIIIAISSIILVLLIIGATIGILVPIHNKNASLEQKNSIKAICNSTLYQDLCYSSIYSLKMSSHNNPSHDPDSREEIFGLSLQVVLNELVRVKSEIRLIPFGGNESAITRNAFNICDDLVKDAIDHVKMSISSFQLEKISRYVVSDIRTWLSTAMTDQRTCLDGLMEFKSVSSKIQDEMKAVMDNATKFTSNSLAIVTNIFGNIQDFQIPIHRKLFFEAHEMGFLQRKMIETEEVILRPNVTVAKDGSGDYGNISEAVSVMPKRSDERFFIYVKEGVYEENVFVDSDCWNLMIYGDGMKRSIVSGSLNFADGVATYLSGTLIAQGRGFFAKDMGFRNKAGPEKFQAVALRSSSDQSIFYRCFFDGYQDTLYAHTNRQFYRDCLITGTIDFIFGNAAAIFQNCTIQPKQPTPGQYNTITAQEKSDPNQNTGFSIQRSVISPFFNLTAQTFLGRPWGNYSTTVITKSNIEGIIDPAGWIPWEPNSEPPGKLFYAEYKNSGLGSDISQRVKWAGYRPNLTEEEAEKFSVEPFIQGSLWLTKANVEYDSQIL